MLWWAQGGAGTPPIELREVPSPLWKASCTKDGERLPKRAQEGEAAAVLVKEVAVAAVALSPMCGRRAHGLGTPYSDSG